MNIAAQTTEEKVIWYAITGTYGFFLLGALYLLAPAMAWILLLVGLRRLRAAYTTGTGNMKLTLPTAIWVWIIAMGAMLFALLIAHADFDLGVAQTLKSSIGWAKGWALLALFPLIGCMRIRAALLYRAACVLCAQTLIVLPLCALGYLAGLPEVLYVSPLLELGGPGPEFFDVSIYSINPENGMPRWRLFTPWGPALGFVGTVYFFLALAEPHRRWRLLGIVGSLAMVVASGSRLGLLAIPIVLLLSWILSGLRRPAVYWSAAAGSVLVALVGVHLVELFETFMEKFHAARADSSRVRATLGRMAIERWANEAWLWGHGIVEKGPHLVEFMPIGSHHTWYGLLFVKGVVGFVALAVPMLWSAVELVRRAQHSRQGTVALQLLLAVFMYTFGENLEILAYLYWPALVMIGIALKEPARAARTVAPLRPTQEQQPCRA